MKATTSLGKLLESSVYRDQKLDLWIQEGHSLVMELLASSEELAAAFPARWRYHKPAVEHGMVVIDAQLGATSVQRVVGSLCE